MRVVSPVAMCQAAFLVPVLSSGAMIYASGASERMRTLLVKSFKAMLGLTLIPMALIAAFGTYVIEAWTGQSDSHLRVALWLICLAGVFQALSWLGAVLYRVSGRAVLDNIREVLRIGLLFGVCIFAPRLGFNGVLAGLVGVEFIGMLFTLFAMMKAFPAFRVKALLPDALRLGAATVGLVVAAGLAAKLPSDSMQNARLLATAKVAAVSLATLLCAYPVLYVTGAISRSEVRSILDLVRKRRAAAVPLASA
jgi:O-antigen/teichoic acid export membrane protein